MIIIVFKNIRALREDKDIKQREIAEYLGISQNTYSQYETGIIAFTDQVLIKLADFYNVSVDYLMDRTNIKEPYPTKNKTTWHQNNGVRLFFIENKKSTLSSGSYVPSKLNKGK